MELLLACKLLTYPIATEGTKIKTFDRNIQLFTICATAFFGMAGGAMVAPTLPAIMAEFSVTGELIGLVVGAYTFSTAVFMPIIGLLSDRFGRKTMLVPALIVNGLAGLGSALSGSFELIILFRFLQGIGIAGMMPVAMTLIGDLFEGQERIHAMGVLSATTGVGSAAAPFLGGILSGISWRIPFLLYLLTIPLAFLVLSIIPQSNQRIDKGESTLKKYITSFFHVPNRKRIAGILYLSFFSFLLLYALIIYIPILLTTEKFGLTGFWAGLFLAVQGISSGTAATQARRLSGNFRRPMILASGFLLMSLGLGCVFLSTAIWQIIGSLLVFGFGFGSVQPQLNTWITEQVGRKQRGGLVSVFNMLKYIGQTTAPLLYGLLLTLADVHYVFLLAAGLGIGAVLIALSLRRFAK